MFAASGWGCQAIREFGQQALLDRCNDVQKIYFHPKNNGRVAVLDSRQVFSVRRQSLPGIPKIQILCGNSKNAHKPTHRGTNLSDMSEWETFSGILKKKNLFGLYFRELRTVETTFPQPCYFCTASLKGQPAHPFDD